MQWTTDQTRVIESRGQNLLVAAAAGSGKTAVLVQHVLDQITDPVNPLSVSELLVVTFTRAAAAEMKERLRSRMEELLEEDPMAGYLQHQISLLDTAHISTIDSFCQWIVKNYFHALDIDPDFRILDEGEGQLLREDVLTRVLEKEYTNKSDAFIHFMDAYSNGKGDQAIRKLILQLYRFSESAPWQEDWVWDSVPEKIPSVLGEMPCIGEIESELRDKLSQYHDILAMAQQVCLQQRWLEKYEEMFMSDRSAIAGCMEAEDLMELRHRLSKISFIRKPTITKKKQEDPILCKSLSDIRDFVKKGISKIIEKYCLGEEEDILKHFAGSAADLRELARLVCLFQLEYRRAKKEKNAAEFADVAHWALQLLMYKDEEGEHYTELADQLTGTFREIIIDEYQDSNLIQEKLLTALSGERFGQPNMFMVGDVKQSIYKFRMAKPELFMDKYHRYTYKGGPNSPGCKIDLSMNFRSRRTVLAAVNRLFYQVMGRQLGGIEYDEHAALYPGASYPEPESDAELLITLNTEGDLDNSELEAHRIAGRIRELMDPENPFMVWDNKSEAYRPVEYRDMVILVRSMEGWADNISGVLNASGIPAYAQLKKGYFQAGEVQILLNMLRLLDNPRQDIPLASVMHSPIGDFNEEEMGWLSADSEASDFYQRCCDGAANGICSEKWKRLQDLICRYRGYSVYLGIAELLEKLIDETDYRHILAASPDGEVRIANVEMLMQKARSFENTIYHGVFHFLRYMEKMQTYEMDFGEASILSESENLVRITSIHKSKGLEYPVVILAGLGKKFNLMDSNSSVLIHDELGLAAADIDTENRTRSQTITRNRLADRLRAETRGEELRILYVAMTRAREKLICTATIDKTDAMESMGHTGEMIRECRSLLGMPSMPLPAVLVNHGDCYLDWFAMAGMTQSDTGWFVEMLEDRELTMTEASRMAEAELLKERWLSQGFRRSIRPEIRDAYDSMKNYAYPYASSVNRKSVWSVSQLKHTAADEYLRKQQGITDSRADSSERDERTRNSGTSDGPNLGALRGTAYHLIFQLMPCEIGRREDTVRAFIRDMSSRGMIPEEVYPLIKASDFPAFYQSDLGLRMASAEKENRLYKEQPFVMGVPMEEDFVLVQGIIDAFLEEDDHLVLWDYKTDKVPDRNPEEYLVGIYQEQLHQYQRALEQARGLRVQEIWIYSVSLGRTIPVPPAAD